MAGTNAILTDKHAAYLGLNVGKLSHWAYTVDRPPRERVRHHAAA